MEEQRNVKWILIISLIMSYVTIASWPTIIREPSIQFPPPSRDIWFYVWSYVNRLGTLLFLATVTTAALFSAGFGKKELVYKLTLYFFILSMGLFFLSLLGPLFT